MSSDTIFAATSAPRATPEVDLRRIPDAHGPEFLALVNLLPRCAGYYWNVFRRLPNRSDADWVVQSRPPGVKPSQKYVWGVWHDDEMVGVLDVIRQWPQQDRLYIGYLQIEDQLQGRSLGQAALRALVERTKSWNGIRRWRLAVPSAQADSRRFWEGRGFRVTGEKETRPPFQGPLLVMERNVPPPSFRTSGFHTTEL